MKNDNDEIIKDKTFIVDKKSNKSPVVAALLSLFLFGGAGHIYLGQWKKGCVLILVTIISAVFWMYTFPVIGAFDAYLAAKKLRNGGVLGELELFVNWKIIVLALIINTIVICLILVYSCC